MKRPLVGVVADDITGSGDIGIMFAKHGYAVRIFSAETDLDALPERLAAVRTDVAIIDTDSRLDTAPVAYEKVRRATAALRRWGAEVYHKKTCSVFRGNVGVEFDALLDELGARFGVAIAAFPKNGRQTRGGVHYVHGKPLAESEFARDPVHPRTESNIVVDTQRQTQRRVGLLALESVAQGPQAVQAALKAARAEGVNYALCDAVSQEDLYTLAQAIAAEPVLMGSSAIAEELPRVWPPAPPFDPLEGYNFSGLGAVLVIAGSVMPQTRAQVEALAAAGGAVVTASGAAVLTSPEAEVERLTAEAVQSLRKGLHTCVRSENWPEAVDATKALGAELGLKSVEVNRRISSVLAQVAERVLRETGSSRLITLGGDTSAAVCRQLGVTETVLLQEIQPGLPSTLAPGPRPLLLVLKSGSFGAPDFVLKAIEHLNGLVGGR